MQFKRFENKKFKCYIVENDLYVKFEGRYFYGQTDNLKLSSISFIENDWQGLNCCKNLYGIYVSINGRKEHLKLYHSYHISEEILDKIPTTYDKELLQEIEDIVGIKEDFQDDLDYEHDKFFGKEEKLEYVKATLIELTIKHARSIANLKNQTGILDLVQTIDRQKQKEEEMKKEIAKLKSKKKKKVAKSKNLNSFYNVSPNSRN